jgi:hypothetical protein
MRTNLPFILERMDLNLAESGTDVVLKWMATTGGTPDPVTGAVIGGSSTPQSETVKAFVHFVQPGTSAVKLFNEIELGDLIIDFGLNVTLEGRKQLGFEVAGLRYVQKDISEKLAASWDVIFQGQKLYRTVLCRRAT